MLKFIGYLWRTVTGRRGLQTVEGDSLPAQMPEQDLVLAQESGEQWCVGMLCPCGCGTALELLLIPEAKPRWDVKVDWLGRPTLTPSVWMSRGCKSHFWLRRGKVYWCT